MANDVAWVGSEYTITRADISRSRQPQGVAPVRLRVYLIREVGVLPPQACALRPVTEGKGVVVRRGPSNRR